MKEFNFEKYEKNLPDCYAKYEKDAYHDEDSNNVKLFRLKTDNMGELRTDIKSIFDCLDIENMTGKTLDFFGADMGQPRGRATDEQYRVMIKAKIARNICNGDFNSVIEAICLTLNCDPTEISMKDSEKAATVTVERLPLAVITKAGFTPSQTIALIESLMPTGGGIEEFNFEGTFELCATEGDMDVDGTIKGLTDTEEHMDIVLYPNAVGGYLGAIYEGNESDLPI